MWSRESPMKEYARKHPGCSLQEYCEYLDNIAREEAERRRLKEEENNQLLKSFEGKCFQINFNRQSFGYFEITKDITAFREDVKEDFYDEEIIAIDKKLGIVVTKENNEVNYYWVKDPNSKPSLYRRGTYNSLVL